MIGYLLWLLIFRDFEGVKRGGGQSGATTVSTEAADSGKRGAEVP